MNWRVYLARSNKQRSFARLRFLLFLLSPLLGVAFLGPQVGAEGKIGFFDSQRVLAESKRLNAVRAEFEARRLAKEKEVEVTQKALQDFVRTAKERSAKETTGNPELPGALGQIRSQSLLAERLPEARTLNETLDRLKREALELRSQGRDELRTRILTAVREFARQHGYSAIFDRTRAGAVHVEDEVDITPALIQWIDRSR